MADRRSRVAWPSLASVGGDLEPESQQGLRRLLDEFALALEDEAAGAEVSLFAFPIFRDFNLVAVLTSEGVYYAISPSLGGVSKQQWLDWRERASLPTMEEFKSAVERELGWPAVSLLRFPLDVLEQETGAREDFLRERARDWTNEVVEEVERHARVVRLNPIFQGRDFLVENDLCFVLMPFREPFMRLYDEHVRPTLEELGLRVMKADDIFTPTAIVEDIWEHINRSRFVVADVTGKNPNVYYELGVAHTVGKDAIILTQNEDDVPFDLRHLRYFAYTDNQEGWGLLRRDLRRAARAVLGL